MAASLSHFFSFACLRHTSISLLLISLPITCREPISQTEGSSMQEPDPSGSWWLPAKREAEEPPDPGADLTAGSWGQPKRICLPTSNSMGEPAVDTAWY